MGKSAIKDLKVPYVMGELILNFSCSSFHVFEALKQKAVLPSSVFIVGICSMSQSLECVPYVTGFQPSKDLRYSGKVPSIVLKINRPMFVSSVDQRMPTYSYVIQDTVVSHVRGT